LATRPLEARAMANVFIVVQEGPLSMARKSRRKVGGLGEEGLRDLIVSHLGRDPQEILGYGDDAVAFELGNGEVLVAHIDALVGSTDVPPGMPPFYVGWKAVVMNVSDIASKGARPLSLLFSWSLPGDFPSRGAARIAQGMNAAARRYGTYVTGGDTGEAKDLVLAGMALGIARKSSLMRRGGAGPGDILAVTGKFGLTSIGYKVLLDGWDAPRAVRRAALDAVYAPEARLKEALAVAKAGGVTACMDCSDGLARSIHYLSQRSKIGFVISEIPIADKASRFASLHRLDPVELALYEGGEEYELVLCVKRNCWRKVCSAVKASGGRLYAMGEAIAERRVYLKSEGGSMEEVEPIGWQHFSRWARPHS
jgi:thiamine-monophosphate kinase